MIISRTPFRVSLFGGGTDYASWFREHGGAVIGTAIDKYCYLSVRPLPPFFAHKHRIVYSKIELVHEIDEIVHPAVRGVLSEVRPVGGLEIHHDADLPARSGLGSSSSFTVGLLHALYAAQGRMISKLDLSREAIRIEQEVIRETVGCQDQIWAAYGGFNRIDFHTHGGFTVSPLIVTPERRDELRGAMVLAFTGFSRISSEIATDQLARMQDKRSQLKHMRRLVDEATALLTASASPIEPLGRLLHESWMLKRELSPSIATAKIDEIYAAGREAGAYGGKLLGAGGGGFLLFIVPPERMAALRKRLKELVFVPFGFDFGGSRIVVYEPNGLDQA
jgi:D-glycero-alpha-D-manno-heptose-7-phosphate kinase